MKSANLKLTVVALSALLAGGSALAHSPSDAGAASDLGKLSAAANLVIHGKVTSVVFRMSAPGANGSQGIPFTFVTYAASDVLQGTMPGGSITLRFPGGSDGRGGFVDVENVPLFQVGDEDVLFVAGNGENGCPLVQCEFGRFRVLNNAVYGPHGEPVVGVNGGSLTLEESAGPAQFSVYKYPAPSFDGLMTNPNFVATITKSGMSVAQARARYLAEAPKFIELREVDGDATGVRASGSPGLPLQTFTSSIGAAVAAAGTRSFTAVASARLDAPLAVPAAVASVPPSVPRSSDGLSPGPVIRKN